MNGQVGLAVIRSWLSSLVVSAMLTRGRWFLWQNMI